MAGAAGPWEEEDAPDPPAGGGGPDEEEDAPGLSAGGGLAPESAEDAVEGTGGKPRATRAISFSSPNSMLCRHSAVKAFCIDLPKALHSVSLT